MVYIMMIHAMLLTLGYREVAENLLKKKDAIKEYLLKENWSTHDMTAHSFFRDKYGWNCYGEKVNNMLSGRGVYITFQSGVVHIGTADQCGDITYPYIECT